MTLMKLISINCTLSYFLSQTMGEVLALKEGHPVEVHSGLIYMIKSALKNNREEFPLLSKEFKPGLQINTNDFYFADEEIIPQLNDLYKREEIFQNIHQRGDAQPIDESEIFLSETLSNIKMTENGWGKNICIHLPIRQSNDIDEVVNNCCRQEILESLKNNPQVSLDLENNHHNSFFGDLYNCMELIDGLDDNLQEMGLAQYQGNFNFTFDYGHFVTQAYFCRYDKRKMLTDFFEQKGKRIKTLHIHNNDGIHKDQHIMMGILPQKILENVGKIGSKEVQLDTFKENQELFFDTFPILNWKNNQNTNLVIEIDAPYTEEDLIKCVNNLYKHF